ncbi:hypothetical protein AVEN_177604-1 [Araneus ventricosus]|uniref:Uncharacterized protein n=1 Tax=Araneus ventricosus TaxID=182803 RepID=A0A4Y2ELU4_ARAVE|nr:hypothetical protein AVEN_177604-1 [Araneus ventricosus]
MEWLFTCHGGGISCGAMGLISISMKHRIVAFGRWKIRGWTMKFPCILQRCLSGFEIKTIFILGPFFFQEIAVSVLVTSSVSAWRYYDVRQTFAVPTTAKAMPYIDHFHAK